MTDPICKLCHQQMSEVADASDPNVITRWACLPCEARADAAEAEQAACELCGGTGEIENASTMRGDRDTIECPACVGRELRAEIARLTALASEGIGGVDLAPRAQHAGRPLDVTLPGDIWAGVAKVLMERKLLDLEESELHRIVTLMPVAFVCAKGSEG